MLSLEKRRLQEDHIAAFQYFKGSGKGLFTKTGCDRMKGNGFKLEEALFSLKVVKYWNRMPTEVVEAPTWKCSKPGGMILGDVPAHSRELEDL